MCSVFVSVLQWTPPPSPPFDDSAHHIRKENGSGNTVRLAHQLQRVLRPWKLGKLPLSGGFPSVCHEHSSARRRVPTSGTEVHHAKGERSEIRRHPNVRRRSHIQQGAPWLIRCPAVCSVRRLTDLVKKKAISEGVSPDMEFILTDSSGYALQDDERPDVSRKILAAPRHNFERHFGECVSLAEQLSSRTPEGQKSEKRRSSSDSLGKRRLFSSSVTDSDTDDVDDRDLAESELDSARTKNQSSACRSKDSSTYSATSAVDQEIGGHSSVEATLRNILQDANLPWLTYFVVDELREAFACPLCQDVLDQPVVCPDCQDVVGGVRCVNERLSTSEPVSPKNGCTNFVERRLQLKGRFDKSLQRLQKYDVPLPAERNRPTVRCFEQ